MDDLCLRSCNRFHQFVNSHFWVKVWWQPPIRGHTFSSSLEVKINLLSSCGFIVIFCFIPLHDEPTGYGMNSVNSVRRGGALHVLIRCKAVVREPTRDTE